MDSTPVDIWPTGKGSGTHHMSVGHFCQSGRPKILVIAVYTFSCTHPSASRFLAAAEPFYYLHQDSCAHERYILTCSASCWMSCVTGRGVDIPTSQQVKKHTAHLSGTWSTDSCKGSPVLLTSSVRASPTFAASRLLLPSSSCGVGGRCSRLVISMRLRSVFFPSRLTLWLHLVHTCFESAQAKSVLAFFVFNSRGPTGLAGQWEKNSI